MSRKEGKRVSAANIRGERKDRGRFREEEREAQRKGMTDEGDIDK